MYLRTLLFFVVMYFLVRIISRLFLPSSNRKKGRGGANFMYRTFQQMAQQQNQKRQDGDQQSTSGDARRFEEIEEAEYEEITDEEKSTSTSSD